MKYINKPKVLDFEYETHFQRECFRLYARSDKAAKQKAIEYLRAKKKDYDKIHIHRIE